jgi:catechol 2,3-dioxygenase-like lactoylglutathione lyase family enzyme
VATARYLVSDVEQAIAFYTQQLGFELIESMVPAFAIVRHGDLSLWLSGPKSSAARTMPDGARPEPGGWNRVVVEVDDLAARAAAAQLRGFVLRAPDGVAYVGRFLGETGDRLADARLGLSGAVLRLDDFHAGVEGFDLGRQARF